MNFKETFLKLTEYTIPFGMESTLEKYLPSGIQIDEFGNYFIKVGESRTLFTCHLDTCSTKHVKVNHVIVGNIIKTDGTTLLGSDNKSGVCILLYMIEQKIPGIYYFFIGEEPTGGGMWGSRRVAGSNVLTGQVDRAVAFDRRDKYSVITRQMGGSCCSDEFAGSLIQELNKSGLNMKRDPGGSYTDTAAFMNYISECTNISNGGFNEHSNSEYVDIAYVEQMAKAACLVDWENLPTVRVCEVPNYYGY